MFNIRGVKKTKFCKTKEEIEEHAKVLPIFWRTKLKSGNRNVQKWIGKNSAFPCPASQRRFGNMLLPGSLTRYFGFSHRPLQFCSDQLWVKTAALSGRVSRPACQEGSGSWGTGYWSFERVLARSTLCSVKTLEPTSRWWMRMTKRFWWAGSGLIMAKAEERAENFSIWRNLHRNGSSLISLIPGAYQFPHRWVKHMFQQVESSSSVHSAAALVSDQSLHLDASNS